MHGVVLWLGCGCGWGVGGCREGGRGKGSWRAVCSEPIGCAGCMQGSAMPRIGGRGCWHHRVLFNARSPGQGGGGVGTKPRAAGSCAHPLIGCGSLPRPQHAWRPRSAEIVIQRSRWSVHAAAHHSDAARRRSGATGNIPESGEISCWRRTAPSSSSHPAAAVHATPTWLVHDENSEL